MQAVIELIYIKNSRWFDDHMGVADHSHLYQLALETPPVAVTVASAGDHFHVAPVTDQVRKQHHVDIYRAVVVLEDADIFALGEQVLHVLP